MISTLLLALGAILVVLAVLAFLGLSIGGLSPVPMLVVGIILIVLGYVLSRRPAARL